MKPVKSLYLHLGRMHCSAHGHLYIDFLVKPGLLGWLCSASLPNGNTCRNKAVWASCSNIRELDVRTLAEQAVRATTLTEVRCSYHGCLSLAVGAFQETVTDPEQEHTAASGPGRRLAWCLEHQATMRPRSMNWNGYFLSSSDLKAG